MTRLSRLLVICLILAASFGGSFAFAQKMQTHGSMGMDETSDTCILHCLTATMNDDGLSTVIASVGLFAVAAVAVVFVSFVLSENRLLPQPVRVRPGGRSGLTVIKRE